ncbi:MAG TPA: transposase [Kofleriaceae bacterium]|nr:transposase [Kofleriaceae bacterium]
MARETKARASSRRKAARQLSLQLPATWGGARRGAGRKPKNERPEVRHASRPPLEPRFPVHVTTRVVKGAGYLRGHRVYPAVRRALCAARDRLGTRIIHFSIQSNHIHLLVEASDQIALGRAMKGFGVRVARRLNRLAGRKGRVIADRYHARYLRTPTEVRRGLVYVLQNGVKHARNEGRIARGENVWIDPHSSAAFFDGWHPRCQRWIPKVDAPAHPLHGRGPPATPVASPSTWLLQKGWLKAGGPIDVREVPAIDP